MNEKYQYFDGVRFTRNARGYYVNSTIRKRMHVYVYEYYYGKVPEGYEIHHKDFDKSNNDINNLEMLTKYDHRMLHAAMLTDEQRATRRDNLNAHARQKAIEWHKSEAGRAWHREHYRKMKDKLCKLHK